jgi:hypothetical protein
VAQWTNYRLSLTRLVTSLHLYRHMLLVHTGKIASTRSYAHLKMAQASVTGEGPAWVALVWAAAESTIDTTISVIIDHLIGDVRGLGVLLVRAHMLSPDLRPRRQPLQARNSAVYLAETVRRRILGQHLLSLTASATSHQTHVATALCSVRRQVRWQATLRRPDLCTLPGRAITCSRSLETLTTSVATVVQILHRTFIILVSRRDTRVAMVSSSPTIFLHSRVRPRATVRMANRTRIRKTATAIAAAG